MHLPSRASVHQLPRVWTGPEYTPNLSALYARSVRQAAPVERRISAILSERIPSQVVAVLPFRNLAQDSSEQYFSDGLADDVIARLAPLRDLRIIPFTSVAPYRNREPSMDELRQRFGATAVLEGGVRRDREAIEDGYTLHRWIAFDPRLEALHDDPRFGKLVARAKWRADSLRALVNANRRR